MMESFIIWNFLGMLTGLGWVMYEWNKKKGILYDNFLYLIDR